MWRLFGRKKEDTKPLEVDLPEAILRNKAAIETLEKRQIHLEKRIAAQEEDAHKRAKEGDKRGALFALKRKKMYEKELEQLGSAHLTLEQQIMTLESAQTQQMAVGALAAGITAQKALNQQLNISKIDDLMEDLQEQQQVQNELSSILCQGNAITDDSELLAELHRIEVKQLEEALVDAAPVPEGIIGTSVAASPQAVTKVQSSSSMLVGPTISSSSLSRPGASPIRNAALTDEEQLKQLLNELS